MSLRVNFNILNQKGTPAFYSDVFANRPTFGYAGRVFISTDTGAIYEDTGTAWTLIADAGAGTTGTLQQVTTNGKTTDQGITVTAGDISTNKLSITGTAGTNGLLSLVQNSAVLSGVTDKTTIYGLGNTSIYMNLNTFGNNYAARFNFGLVDPNVTAKILYIPNGDGVLSLSNTGLTGYNTVPNTSFANSQFYSGLISPLESHVYKIGVTGTAQANSSDANQWGVGVYGAGYTNGATRAAGVKGDGEVTNSSDTGSAIGVRGYATATHAGGLNIGILGEASGSSTGNYGLYTNMASAANTYANYHLGTAFSYFGGAGRFNGRLFSTSDAEFGDLTSTTGSIVLSFDATGQQGYITSRNYATATDKPLNFNGSTHIFNGGYVGVNCTPNAQFEVLGTNGNALTDGIRVSRNTLQNTQYGVINYTSGILNITGVDTGSAGAIRFNTSNGTTTTERVRITSSNNGTLSIGTSEAAANSINFYGNYSNNQPGYAIYGSSANLILEFNGNTKALYLGNLGTGTLYSNSGIISNTSPSDIRLKDNVQVLKYGLKDILKLRPVTYNWKKDEINQGIQFGFIAQEVQEVIPEAVKEFGTDIKYLGLEKDAIYAALVNAIKELNDKIDNLKN